MRFLDQILKRPTVTVFVESGSVVFDHDGEQVREEPLISVAEDGKIAAVGREAQTTDRGKLIRLFVGDTDADKTALRAYSRYLLMLVLSGSSFRRPRVEVVEQTFRRAFGAGAAESLVAALRSDGFQAELTDAR